MWFDLVNPRIIFLRSPTLGSEQADCSNIILRVPRSNHKEQGKFKDNVIKKTFGEDEE